VWREEAGIVARLEKGKSGQMGWGRGEARGGEGRRKRRGMAEIGRTWFL